MKKWLIINLVFLVVILFSISFIIAAGTCSGTPTKCDKKTENACNNECACIWVESCTVVGCSECGSESDCGGAQGCTWIPEEGGGTTTTTPTEGGIQGIVSIFPRVPSGGEVLYCEPIQLKVEIFYLGEPSNHASVKANSSMFGEVSLKHEFDLPSGIYVANVTIKDKEYGSKKILYTANQIGEYNEASIFVTLKPGLEIITDLEELYPKDSLMRFNGTVLNKKQKPENNSLVKISGYQNEKKVFYIETFTNKEGNFYSEYLIKHGDPEGIWKILIEAESEEKESGFKSLSTQISVPAGVQYYSVNFLSPLQEKTFKRGEIVPITIEIKDMNEVVNGASVTVSAPSGDSAILKEVGEGKYSGAYLIKANDQIGDWFLKAEVKKQVGDITKVGGANVLITVGPAEINFNVLSPSSDVVYTNSRMKIKLKLAYPDGSLAKGVSLNAFLLNKNEDIPLKEVSDGIYEGSYFVGTEDVGALMIKIDAKDANDNFATLNKEVFVRKRSFVGNILAFIWDVMKQYWWAILAALIVAGFIFKPKFEALWIKGRIQKSLNEQKNIKTMQIETEKKYYKEGAITKKEFRDIIEKYEERNIKAKEKEKIYKKMLDEIKKIKH